MPAQVYVVVLCLDIKEELPLEILTENTFGNFKCSFLITYFTNYFIFDTLIAHTFDLNIFEDPSFWSVLFTFQPYLSSETYSP